jgi:hypothetical protein
MLFVEDNDMIKAVSRDRFYKARRESVLRR